MNQLKRREYLIRYLFESTPRYRGVDLPRDEGEQRRILRALLNVRAPGAASAAFLDVQDAYLREEIRSKGITDVRDLTPFSEGLYLWRGDITTLKIDAIVNAANDRLLGCFVPCHTCIDNAIHTYAGVQLRLECHRLMEAQGHPEGIGAAKITQAYNLPSGYVLHTVGPTVEGALTEAHRAQLARCYVSCLDAAAGAGLSSIAFPCISTGVFRFPKRAAAGIALKTVRDYLDTHATSIQKVVFTVYEEGDDALYRELTGGN